MDLFAKLESMACCFDSGCTSPCTSPCTESITQYVDKLPPIKETYPSDGDDRRIPYLRGVVDIASFAIHGYNCITDPSYNIPIASATMASNVVSFIYHKVPCDPKTDLFLQVLDNYMIAVRIHVNADEWYGEIASDLRVGSSGSDLIDEMIRIKHETKVPQTLTDVNIPAEAIPTLAEDAMAKGRVLRNNPREVTYDAVVNIYETIL